MVGFGRLVGDVLQRIAESFRAHDGFREFIGSDDFSFYRMTYVWHANQVGHFAIGFFVILVGNWLIIGTESSDDPARLVTRLTFVVMVLGLLALALHEARRIDRVTGRRLGLTGAGPWLSFAFWIAIGLVMAKFAELPGFAFAFILFYAFKESLDYLLTMRLPTVAFRPDRDEILLDCFVDWCFVTLGAMLAYFAVIDGAPDVVCETVAPLLFPLDTGNDRHMRVLGAFCARSDEFAAFIATILFFIVARARFLPKKVLYDESLLPRLVRLPEFEARMSYYSTVLAVGERPPAPDARVDPEAALLIEAFMDRRVNHLVIIGEVRTGKTSLATAVASELIMQRQASTQYLTAFAAFDLMRAVGRQIEDYEQVQMDLALQSDRLADRVERKPPSKRLETLSEADCVVIDDISPDAIRELLVGTSRVSDDARRAFLDAVRRQCLPDGTSRPGRSIWTFSEDALIEQAIMTGSGDQALQHPTPAEFRSIRTMHDDEKAIMSRHAASSLLESPGALDAPVAVLRLSHAPGY